jgi:hypothetical protein
MKIIIAGSRSIADDGDTMQCLKDRWWKMNPIEREKHTKNQLIKLKEQLPQWWWEKNNDK